MKSFKKFVFLASPKTWFVTAATPVSASPAAAPVSPDEEEKERRRRRGGRRRKRRRRRKKEEGGRRRRRRRCLGRRCHVPDASLAVTLSTDALAPSPPPPYDAH